MPENSGLAIAGKQKYIISFFLKRKPSTSIATKQENENAKGIPKTPKKLNNPIAKSIRTSPSMKITIEVKVKSPKP
jgi:hypothetical protein